MSHCTTPPLGVYLQKPNGERKPASVEEITQALDEALGAKALATGHKKTIVHQFTTASITVWVPPNGSGGTHGAILITLMGRNSADKADMQRVSDTVRAYEYANGDKYPYVFKNVRDARDGTTPEKEIAALAEELGIS